MGETYIIHGWGTITDILNKDEGRVGLIVIGNAKERGRFVYSTLERAYGKTICLVSKYCSVASLERAFGGSEVVCISMTPKDTKSRKRKRDIVTMLRSAGAKTIYGVYLYEKREELWELPKSALEDITSREKKLDRLIFATD